MNKAALIREIADRTGIHKAAVGNMFDALEEIVTETLSMGDEVTLPGIGKLKVKHRDARMGRNPVTGEPVDIPDKNVPAMSFAASLKEAIGA